MFDQFRLALNGISVAVIAAAVPPAIWAKAVWASPFTKTHRHTLAGLLSLVAGTLMCVSLLEHATLGLPMLIGAAATMTVMFAVLFWPARTRSSKVR